MHRGLAYTSGVDGSGESVCRVQLDRWTVSSGLDIPVYRMVETLWQGSRCFEPESIACTRCFQTATRLTVWLIRVPNDFSVVISQVSNLFCKLSNRDLVTASKVDWFGRVVVLSSHQDALSRVICIQEFTCRRTVAPQPDALIAS